MYLSTYVKGMPTLMFTVTFYCACKQIAQADYQYQYLVFVFCYLLLVAGITKTHGPIIIVPSY